MSSGGYRHHKDDRYRRGRPLNRSPQRDQWSKEISRSRTAKHVSDSQGSRRRTVYKKSLDSFVNVNLDDMPMDIGTDGSNSPLQKSLPDSESSSDHDGTPIPDHVWVGEYLDDEEDKGIVPLPCDTYAKEIAYKKAISEISSSSGPDFMNLNRMLRGENEYFSSGGRFSLPFMHGLDAFQRRDEELMPSPMPRIGVTDSMATSQTLKRYHKLYKTMIESMEYRSELEKKHSELMQQTLTKPMPAEVYDYGHGENRALTSREKREHKKSTEFFKYRTKSQGALRSPSNFLDARGRGRNNDSEKRKHRAVMEPIRPTKIMEPGKSVTAKSSSPRSRLVIPTTTPSSFVEFCKLQESLSAMDVPITSSSRSATPATKPFTFQELCDLRKALSRHSSSIPPSESDSSYIPIHTSLVKTSKDSSQEGFPIKVLTTSCRARRRTTKDEEEFPRTQAGKSGESRQPIAQVTPLRIKPILKKVNRDTKPSTLKKDSPEKMENYYAQNSTYRGSFNDTRKVLLDAAKELESRSSKELLTSPRIVIRNAALADPLLQAALPFHMKRHSPDEAFTARRSDQREFVESLFPFHKSLQDSGKKSDDSDDEVEMIRHKRLSHSPSPKRRRRIQSRSRSPPTTKKPRGTRSRSLSPYARYHKKRNQVITPPHQYTGKRSRSDIAPQRLAMLPDKSEEDISESGQGKFGQECYKYDEARGLDDRHRRMLRDTGSVHHNVRNKHSYSCSVDHQAERAEDIRSADRSPVTNIDIHHGKREYHRSLSRHSGIRSVDRDPRERSSSGHRHSPHYRQIKASISPERHEISNSVKRWQVRSLDQPARDRQIQISRSPENERISGLGQRLHLLPDGRRMAVSGHARQFHTLERSTSSPERRVYSDSVQQHKGPSLERQVCTSHSPRSRDGNKTNPYEKSRRPVKRPLRSKSRSTERMIPHYTNRERSSSPWTDESKSESSVREVHRQQRYKHGTMDSIIQEENIPRLLDVEIVPLPSLMDVDVNAKPDVKIKDERRFTSRSTSKERVTPTTISETIFQERQAKKIITNPSGKIVLKRKDEAKPQQGEAKIFRAESKLKATVIPGKRSARKTAKAKSKERPLPVKSDEKPIIGAKFPPGRRAVKTESAEKPIHLKRLRKDEWLENYKFWFQQTVHQVLQDSEQAKELGFQDPISFLDSVTKGNRRSLSFVPRGEAAKEILKFIALNKKSIDQSYNKETCHAMVEEEGKSTAQEEIEDAKAGAAVRSSISKTNSPSTKAVRGECDQGNKFFVIDKKPMEAQIGAILTKKTDEEGDEKGALKKVISPQKSLKTKEQVGVQKKVVKTPTDKKFGVVKKPKAKSSSFIKFNRSTDLPKPTLSSVNQVKSSDPEPHPPICHTPNQSSPVNVTALQTASHENSDIHPTESTSTDPNASTDQKLHEETGQLNETGSPKEAKFRSWQDALLFPEDGGQHKTVLIKDSATADVNVALASVKPSIPHVAKECTVTLATLFEPITTISKSSKMSVVTPTAKRPTKQSQLEVKEKQGSAQKSVATSKEEPDRSSAKTLTGSSRQKPAPRKSLPKKKAAMNKTPAKANIPNATMQSKSNVLPDSDKKKSAKSTTERQSSDSAKSPVFPAPTDFPIFGEASNDPIKAVNVTEKFERRQSHSSTRNRQSHFTEHKSTSRRKSIDKASPRHSRRSDSKRNLSEIIMKREPTDVPSHELSKSRRGHIEIPKTEPDLTPEQESLLPAFKRQIEKSVLKSLNILYKLEKFKEYKIVNTANDAINSASANKEAGFTLQHALYYIWRLYENPSKDALDNIKRQMSKVDMEEPCFDINLKTFFLFQSTVYDLCQQNLNNQVRYASQDHERKKYVRLQSQYHFPQFDCEAHVMMKMWAWRERMYSIAQKNTVHSSSARLKPFPDDGDFNSMEESVAKWLKEVTNMRIYDCPEALSCDLVYEVKRQLMKRKAHATRQEAIMLIACAWTRNYYYKFEKTLLRNSQTQESEKKVESSDHGELMVLDEVYSDESDSVNNIEDSIGVTDDLSGVQIDLF